MFYLVGRGIFCGACEVASDWYESQKLLWPDEIAEQKKKYKNECRVKMVRKGEASFSELIPKLSFVTNRTYAGAYLRGTRGGPANFSKPIPLDDYTTIMSAL
jgi:predicted RNA-binding protein